MVADFYTNISKEESFWVFVSRIDLIEETSGISFPGILDAKFDAPVDRDGPHRNPGFHCGLGSNEWRGDRPVCLEVVRVCKSWGKGLRPGGLEAYRALGE